MRWNLGAAFRLKVWPTKDFLFYQTKEKNYFVPKDFIHLLDSYDTQSSSSLNCSQLVPTFTYYSGRSQRRRWEAQQVTAVDSRVKPVSVALHKILQRLEIVGCELMVNGMFSSLVQFEIETLDEDEKLSMKHS